MGVINLVCGCFGRQSHGSDSVSNDSKKLLNSNIQNVKGYPGHKDTWGFLAHGRKQTGQAQIDEHLARYGRLPDGYPSKVAATHVPTHVNRVTSEGDNYKNLLQKTADDFAKQQRNQSKINAWQNNCSMVQMRNSQFSVYPKIVGEPMPPYPVLEY